MQVIDSYSIHSDSTHLADDELDAAIAERATEYQGPIHSATGKMLWAIQAWYADARDTLDVDEILASYNQPVAALY